MTSKPILAGAIAVLTSAAVLAEKPAATPVPKAQPVPRAQPVARATVTPRPVATPLAVRTPVPNATPVPKATPAAAATPAPGAAATPEETPAPKKQKGPTVITSQRATFNQRTNVAVFLENVVVVDPEFNVQCEKLTAFLKNDEDVNPPGTPAPKSGPKGSATPKPVATPGGTPAAAPGATPAGTPGADGAAATPPPKKHGGLDHAIAETTPGKRVLITQDKKEADGTITHGTGTADRATYETATGDVVLYGAPEVKQGGKSVVAVDPAAVITMNRDGRLHAVGMTRTTIENSEQTR
jgi:lipopolysaccharide export system protein LptA